MIYIVMLYYHDQPIRRAQVQPRDPTNLAEAEELVTTLNTRTLLETGYEYRIEEL